MGKSVGNRDEHQTLGNQEQRINSFVLIRICFLLLPFLDRFLFDTISFIISFIIYSIILSIMFFLGL